MNRKYFLPMLLCAVVASPAAAQSDSGFYVSGFIGGGFPSDAEFSGVQAPETGAPGAAGAPAIVDAEFDSDTTLGVALGYDLPYEFFGVFHPRLELEYSTLDADVSTGSFNGGNQSFGGDLSIDFFLINNYTDIIWQDNQTVVPYFGGGLGIASVDANVLYAGGGATAPTFGVVGEDDGFVGTFALGASWQLADQWDIYGEGRYYRIQDIELERRFIADGANLLNAKVDDTLDGTTLTAGVRYRF
ncbi:MAG: outer membrane beta-barrel protein [Pseudomonadota bacterium]